MSGEHTPAGQPATPYEIAKASGMHVTRYSPDAFAIVEEFANGQRFLHNPCIGYPVQLPWVRPSTTPAKP